MLPSPGMRRVAAAILLGVLCAACGDEVTPAGASSPHPIVVQGAMDVEVQTLVAALDGAKPEQIAGWTFWSGKVDGYPVVIFKTRRGMAHASAATAIAVVLGVAAAFPLVRGRFRGREALNALLMSPLVLPSLVYGLAALIFVSALGFSLSIGVLVLSHVAIIVPYVIRTTAASLALLDPHLEEAARSLGANIWRTFVHVVLPNLLPGIATGGAFAFISSFDNLTVSLFLAGPRVETLPIRLFSMIEFDLDPSVAAISTVLVLITLAVVLLAHRAVGLTRIARL